MFRAAKLQPNVQYVANNRGSQGAACRQRQCPALARPSTAGAPGGPPLDGFGEAGAGRRPPEQEHGVHLESTTFEYKSLASRHHTS